MKEKNNFHSEKQNKNSNKYAMKKEGYISTRIMGKIS